ncbi:MAG: hypothetical protein JO257_07395 [Deltaproteobacteria bacterium]|nr:hypothetical protein [Deltaproteobacteria bacterium]
MRDFIRRLELEGIPWLHERTVQIHWLDKARNVQVPLGSGVLLKIGDTGFLLSAAHVLRHGRRRTLLMFPTESNVAINLNTSDMRMSIDESVVDVGIARLAPECLAAVEQHRPFLRLDDVVLDDVSPPEGWYAVCGYPGAYTDTDLDARFVTSKALCYTSELFGKALACAVDGVTLALEFAAHSIDSTGETGDVPDPGGISGCGMWRVHQRGSSSEAWSAASVRLVGIQHSVVSNRKGPLAFRGTRSHCVVAWIWQEFPDMRSEIDRHAPGLGLRFSRPVGAGRGTRRKNKARRRLRE